MRLPEDPAERHLPKTEADIGPALHPVAPEQLGPVETGLPGLRSWGAVYAVVAGVFVLWVILLIAFMRAYS